MDQLAAQLAALFIQVHLMAPLRRDPGRPQTAGTAADDGDFLDLGGGLDHVFPAGVADPGIDGADAAVALVAAQAADDFILPLLHDLGPVVLLADEGPGLGDQVAVAVCQHPLHDIRVLEAAHGGDVGLDPRILQQLAVAQVGRAVLFKEIGIHMGQVAGLGPKLEDVYIGLKELAVGHKVLGGVAAGQGLLPGELHLDGIVVPAGRLDGLEQLHQKPGPVFQAAAVFVGALVQNGAQGLGQDGGVVAGIDVHHVKAHALKLIAVVCEQVDELFDLLLGDLRRHHLVPALTHAGHGIDALGPGRELIGDLAPVVDIGDGYVHGQIDHGSRRGQRAIGVDTLDHLGKHALAVPVLHVIGACEEGPALHLLELAGLAGDDGRAVPGIVGRVLDLMLIGITGGVSHVRHGLGVDDAVFQDVLSQRQGAHDVCVFVAHVRLFLSGKAAANRPGAALSIILCCVWFREPCFTMTLYYISCRLERKMSRGRTNSCPHAGAGLPVSPPGSSPGTGFHSASQRPRTGVWHRGFLPVRPAWARW